MRGFAVRLVAGVVGFGVAGVALAAPMSERRVLACDDDNGWPPYTFRVPTANGASEVRGRSVDLLRLALGRLGWTLELELLPWKRCLAEVAGGRYHLILSATQTPERQRDYWVTAPYYKTQQYYVWNRARWPDGPTVAKAADFAQWRVGGVQGFVYPYLKAVGITPAVQAKSHTNLVDMLFAGRLDTVLIADSILRSQRNREGVLFWDDPNLGRAPVPGGYQNEYHMLISKRWPQGQELLQDLQAELGRMRQRGELSLLMDGR
ncbi:substrate-binding periplasmic protein [Inhella gelatinilytica]|uniref:Transporter substrate-binding domain-containing protein n=1 Tax=Inhella gelatinilytica TaxID=2795030 RepID=A0A931IWN0_9BURK|nr:transporter substrate-binding domain-containing protein [Inhella gelatinilytica]MBH9551408.1 transporter substrate-binding domain-containing protein [Inhella gelatinilytica]